MQYVADVRSNVAYHISCTEKIAGVSQVDRYFYETAKGAQDDGFILAGC
jgi:hypothetical protein